MSTILQTRVIPLTVSDTINSALHKSRPIPKIPLMKFRKKKSNKNNKIEKQEKTQFSYYKVTHCLECFCNGIQYKMIQKRCLILSGHLDRVIVYKLSSNKNKNWTASLYNKLANTVMVWRRPELPNTEARANSMASVCCGIALPGSQEQFEPPRRTS